MAFKESEFQKKSVSLHGHKTSISLEKAFWSLLETSAQQEGISLAQLIQRVDENRKGNLASALRLYALTIALKDGDLFQPSLKHPAGQSKGKKSN